MLKHRGANGVGLQAALPERPTHCGRIRDAIKSSFGVPIGEATL